MNTIAVLENSGEGFADAVLGALADAPGVIALKLPARAENARYDVIVVSPGYSGGARGGCLALLAPDGRAAAGIYAKRVVTYGMSPRSTLTLSSIGGGGAALLSVQRELVTLAGGLVEQQEFPITAPFGADAALASAGGKLLLGISLSSGS